jgi:hypothetical protein
MVLRSEQVSDVVISNQQQILVMSHQSLRTLPSKRISN